MIEKELSVESCSVYDDAPLLTCQIRVGGIGKFVVSFVGEDNVGACGAVPAGAVVSAFLHEMKTVIIKNISIMMVIGNFSCFIFPPEIL
jgi:hypothetical protein